MATLQIEAMPFQISKHLLNPHAAAIQADSGSNCPLVGCQKPRLFLAFSPINDHMGELIMGLGQPCPTEPATTGFVQEAVEALPLPIPLPPQEVVTGLA